MGHYSSELELPWNKSKTAKDKQLRDLDGVGAREGLRFLKFFSCVQFFHLDSIRVYSQRHTLGALSVAALIYSVLTFLVSRCAWKYQ
jgi:hypothetical protein